METIVAYIKHWAKALWALALPFVANWLLENQEWLENKAAWAVGAVITALVVWLQPNGPKPS